MATIINTEGIKYCKKRIKIENKIGYFNHGIIEITVIIIKRSDNIKIINSKIKKDIMLF